MPEPVDFPVPPDDLRFLSRRERSRSPPAPHRPRDPPADGPTRASVAAGRSLRRALWSPWGRRRPATRRRNWPGWAVDAVCVGLAAGWLPVGLIYLSACRPDLRGRRLRARLLTPRDMRRVVFTRSVSLGQLLTRFRI